MNKQDWMDYLLFSPKTDSEIWQNIAKALITIIQNDGDSISHKHFVFPDRLLAECCYGLWLEFTQNAPKTSQRLIEWCDHDKAVLIMDALSLREMPLLLKEAQKRNLNVTAAVTFSEAPSDTNNFAQAIGALSRASLANDGKSSSFKLFGGNCHTDVCSIPFMDVPVPPKNNLVIWHSWLDDQIHLVHSSTELDKQIHKELQGDGFWTLIDKLRQGRKLVITSDHGYGVAEQFSAEIQDKSAIEILKAHFKAQRYVKMEMPSEPFMPPLFVNNNGWCMVMGQRKWKVPSGFPKICHGGLSLLEVASPWLEIDAK